MKLLGNLIWLLFGGIFIALEYLVSSILLMITIIGIPFGFQTLKLAGLALWPFGKDIRSTEITSGCLTIVLNVIWILIGGNLDLFITSLFWDTFCDNHYWNPFC